jgi:hypothetical protein
MQRTPSVSKTASTPVTKTAARKPSAFSLLKSLSPGAAVAAKVSSRNKTPSKAVHANLKQARSFARRSKSCKKWSPAARQRAVRTAGKMTVLVPTAHLYRVLAKKSSGVDCMIYADRALAKLAKAKELAAKAPRAQQRSLYAAYKKASSDVHKTLGLSRADVTAANRSVDAVVHKRIQLQTRVSKGQALPIGEGTQIKTAIKLQLAPLREEGQVVPTDVQVDQMTDAYAMAYEDDLDEQLDEVILEETDGGIMERITERPYIIAGAGAGALVIGYLLWSRR